MKRHTIKEHFKLKVGLKKTRIKTKEQHQVNKISLLSIGFAASGPLIGHYI